MVERVLPNPSLQVMFVSRETSNTPLYGELMKLGQLLQTSGVSFDEPGTASYDYGRRLVITGKNVDVRQMNQADVVEIVDYDPLKNIMLVIGTKEPSRYAPVHWIIQKARQDIMVLLQAQSRSLAERLQGTVPATPDVSSMNALDRAKEFLRALRESKTILIHDEAVLFAGINTIEIEKSFRKYLKERP